ncbi:MAG: hypothetical protein JW779_01745 [Candidatus Thorarchaeota archaeon]|nr:hypothetical protein [Candidatus Thorarchaeota archaeon]
MYIRSDYARILNSDSRPWLIIHALRTFPDSFKSEDFQRALKRAVPRIVKAIRDRENVFDILRYLVYDEFDIGYTNQVHPISSNIRSSSPWIIEIDEIKQALLERINEKGLFHTLGKYHPEKIPTIVQALRDCGVHKEPLEVPLRLSDDKVLLDWIIALKDTDYVYTILRNRLAQDPSYYREILELFPLDSSIFFYEKLRLSELMALKLLPDILSVPNMEKLENLLTLINGFSLYKYTHIYQKQIINLLREITSDFELVDILLSNIDEFNENQQWRETVSGILDSMCCDILAVLAKKKRTCTDFHLEIINTYVEKSKDTIQKSIQSSKRFEFWFLHVMEFQELWSSSGIRKALAEQLSNIAAMVATKEIADQSESGQYTEVILSYWKEKEEHQRTREIMSAFVEEADSPLPIFILLKKPELLDVIEILAVRYITESENPWQVCTSVSVLPFLASSRAINDAINKRADEMILSLKKSAWPLVMFETCESLSLNESSKLRKGCSEILTDPSIDSRWIERKINECANIEKRYPNIAFADIIESLIHDASYKAKTLEERIEYLNTLRACVIHFEKTTDETWVSQCKTIAVNDSTLNNDSRFTSTSSPVQLSDVIERVHYCPLNFKIAGNSYDSGLLLYAFAIFATDQLQPATYDRGPVKFKDNRHCIYIAPRIDRR